MVDHRAGRSIALAAVLSVGMAAGGAIGASAPEPAKPVDAARFYSGVWREIGRRPMKLTDGCVAGATQYVLVGKTRVKVRDTCTKKTPTGPLEAIGGPGLILDPGVNAKMHVSYRFGPIQVATRDYWVLDHDDDYTWFISADPTFEYLWIYTRDPRVNADERAKLVERARALGYDVAKLEFPAQP